ncbi:protein rolling stone-like [Saccostrea cucullata]|uniref:protein rolling stone-like n=1 Tax=Saccostrea cuccullata TaxID=36930 RepID=UPI002ED235C7
MACSSVCCLHCRKEFRLKNFGFADVHPARFVMFQWRLPPILYVVYRMVMAVYADFWLIYTSTSFIGFGTEDMTDIDPGNASTQNGTKNGTDFVLYPWYAYLTNWTYLLLSLYLTWHFFVTVAYLLQNPMPLNSRPDPSLHRRIFSELNPSGSFYNTSDYNSVIATSMDPVIGSDSMVLPWYFKLTWVLYNMANVGSLLVTVVFFVFLWPMFNTSNIGLFNLQLHGINTVLTGIELFLTAIPYRLYHYIYTLMYGLAYLIFSAIFYAAGNTDPIYRGVLDWSKPGQTAVFILLLGFVFMPILQAFLFFIYKLRLLIYKEISKDVIVNENEDAFSSDINNI